MKKLLIAILIALPCAAFSQTAQHLKVSEQFLDVSGARSSFDDVVNSMLDSQLGAIPQEHRPKFIQVMKDFMAKYFNYDLLKPKMANLYANEFSEKELNDLIAFYKSETGKKYASKAAVLTTKGMQMGQATVQEHKEELTEMMKKAFAQ